MTAGDPDHTQTPKPGWHIVVGLALFSVLALSSVLLTQFNAPPPAPSATLAWVTEARFSTTGAAVEDAVTLPHDWKQSDTAGTRGTYHFQADLPAELRDLRPTLYVPHAAQTFTLVVNGHPQPTDLVTGDGAHYWNTPLLVALDPRFLITGENQFSLSLTGHPVTKDNYLSRIYIGPKDTLHPVWAEKHLTRVGIVKTLTTIMMWLSSAMGILFVLRRKETMFGWFALGIFFAALYNANFVVTEIPLAYEQWQAMIFGTLMLSVLFLIMTSNRLASLENARFEKLTFLIAVPGFLPVLLPGIAPYWLHSYGFGVWIVLVLLFGLVAYGLILRHRLRQGNGREALFILAAGTLVASFGLNDILILNGLFPRDRPLLLSYGFFTLIVSQAWFVLTRFTGALNALEEINADLDARVRAREQELQIIHKNQVETARERTLIQERERLMQDMHDGVGGRLISTLSLLESQTISMSDVQEEIRTCVEDIRLTIESLDIDSGDLASLLGSFRYQIAPRLRRQHLKMNWDVAALPQTLSLDPTRSLHFLRILQEAITNTIRHARASQLTIRARLQDTHLTVDLLDDGCGLPDQAQLRSGRGLGNIRKRAQALGGEVAFSAGPDGVGTLIRLTLPCAELQRPLQRGGQL